MTGFLNGEPLPFASDKVQSLPAALPGCAHYCAPVSLTMSCTSTADALLPLPQLTVLVPVQRLQSARDAMGSQPIAAVRGNDTRGGRLSTLQPWGAQEAKGPAFDIVVDKS